MPPTPKTIVIIAGPNGAGKTGFARAFLAHTQMRFINADLIAAGLSPFEPEALALRAGRIMLEEIAASTARGESFSFETTLSGLIWLRHIRLWREQDWRIILYFLALPNVKMALHRVATRVQQGGHSIPEAVIQRRFAAGWFNFQKYYKNAVHAWKHYDNSGTYPILLNVGENQ